MEESDGVKDWLKLELKFGVGFTRPGTLGLVLARELWLFDLERLGVLAFWFLDQQLFA